MKSEHYRSSSHLSADSADLSCEVPAAVSTSTLKQFASRLGAQSSKRRLVAHWVKTDQGLRCEWGLE